MVFTEYMNSLPNVKQDTINKLAEITSSSTMTVYRWMNGSIKPPMVKKKIMAEFLNKKVEVLWPEEEEGGEV